MLLTDYEIKDMEVKAYADYFTDKNDDHDIAFARAVEAAILAKLASAELPEPFPAGYISQTEYFYTADQLRQAFAQGAASQLSAEPVGHFGFVESSQIWEEFHAPAGTPLFTLKEPK